MNTYRSERGQTLVLIILAIVAILGFAALAVDGGRVFAERRRAQNAVDAAALAGSFASLDKNASAYKTDQAVLGSLAQNGYTRDLNLDADPSIPEDVQFFNPPIGNGPYAGNDEYFQVRIRETIGKAFAQFIYGPDLVVTVEAIGRALPTTAISPGQALVAVGKDTCKGITWNGGMNTHIIGGSIFSNSEGTGGSGCYSGITTGSSGNIRVDGGGISMAGDWRNNAGATVFPENVAQNVPNETFPDLPVPYCDDLPEGDVSGGVIHKGKHTSEVKITGGTWTMEAGIHCFYGNFVINGGSVTGKNVLIVMMQGGISFSGSADIGLDRASDLVDGKGQQWGGMFIYMPKANESGIDMSGNNGTHYSGTVYAPGKRTPDSQPKCDIGGTNKSIGLKSNLMCYTVGIAGNSSVTIDYRDEQNYQMPPTVELTQ